MVKSNLKNFSNGLRLITIPMKDSLTVTVLVLVETGSFYESKKQSGLSHFLEHMCFKGTVERPNTMVISSELDSIGSQYNAFTSNEYTGYYAKSSPRHLNKILDIVSDIYLNPTFSKNEIEKEKGVIIEEINMYEDIPQKQVHDLFASLLFGDQPSGRSVLGNKENVKNMKRGDFVKYHKDHYIPNKTLVVVSGQIKEEEILELIKNSFGKLKKQKFIPQKKTKINQKKPKLAIKYKDTDQAHIVLGFRSYNVYHKDNYILDLLGIILSGGFSSRLFMKLREELGVAYYVRAGNNSSINHGDFTISAGVSKDKIYEIIREILKECSKIKDEAISHIELEKSKEYLIGNMKLELESSDAWAMYYGGQGILRKKQQDLDFFEKKIRSITPVQIQNAAKDIFQNKGLNLAIVGPFKDIKSIEKTLYL